MILSVSRRTDIPTYYSEWFFNRIKEGYLCVRNPMNIHQISRIDISPKYVDCIVFWTKNPKPMLGKLSLLSDYTYYFQFTLNGYGKDLERGLPDKETVMIPVFQELSREIGKDRVIWRYDPIVFTEKYDVGYHLETFDRFSRALDGYTEKCVISFVDLYAKNRKNMAEAGVVELSDDELQSFAKKLADMARSHGMVMATCAEKIDLAACGIEHNCCIDRALIEKLTGYTIKADKDKVQRAECGCVESMEVGTYNTCLNGCRYCYANYSPEAVRENCRLYDPSSPLLCSQPIGPLDKVTERKVRSIKGAPLDGPEQMSLFDIMM